MIIDDYKNQVDFLINAKKKFLKEVGTEKGLKAEKKRTKEFVDSFNKEAKKQNSKWYAETDECETEISGKFILTYLCKKIISGWWIFKEVKIIKLHICVYENHTSFVENDYVVSDLGVKANDKVFRFLPEIKPILDKIPQAFFILPKGEIHNLGKRINNINKRIEKIEAKI